MALLGRPWTLHDVDDVERFANGIVNKRRLDWLQPHERDDLITYLVETAWELSKRYDGSQGSRFSSWARYTLDLRTTDFLRREFGRTKWQFKNAVYERELTTVVSLDSLELDRTLTTGPGDPANGGDPDLARLAAIGDRTRARDHELLGLEPPQRAA